MIAAGLWMAWWLVARNDGVVPPPRKPFREVVQAFRDGVWALMMPCIIIFGLKFGVFTPTEAGVVCSVYALLVSIYVYKELKWSQVYTVVCMAGQTTAIVMFLVAAALVSAWLIAIADIPSEVIRMLQPFMGSPMMIMIVIMVLVVIVGTAMDMTPTIMVLTPVVMPVVTAAGIDPVYFGVLFIINNAIGLVTPPVGTTLNVVCGVTKTKMDDIIVGVWPFMVAQLVVLALLIALPSIVLVPLSFLTGK